MHRRLWHLGRGSRVALFVVIGVGLAGAVLTVVQATLLARIVSAVFLDRSGLPAVAGLLAALAAVLALRGAAAWAAEVGGQRCAGPPKAQLRARLLRHLLDLGPQPLAAQRTGELAHSLGGGVDALDGYYARHLPQLALAVLVPPLIIGWVAHVDLLSGLLVAVTVCLVPLFGWLVGVAAARRARRRWHAVSLLSAHFLDVVEGLPTLRLFGRSRAQRETVGQVTERYRRATMGTLRLAFLSSVVLELAAAVNTALVAVAIGLRLVDGSIALQAGLTVLLLVPEVYLPIRQAASTFHASADAAAAARRLFELLDSGPPPGRRARAPAPVPDPRSAVIRLEAVSFRHPGRSRPVLDRVDLEIHPGDRLAIVGPSGAGKSTLLALLLCFLRPTAGRIVVGDADLARLDPDAWRRHLGWLPQRPCLFDGSVADNVRLGDPHADEAGVRRWLGAAGAGAWVDGLAAGVETPVGERGQRLSGGQRQRVALARALARRSPVLLLDEPTANLDAAGAAAVEAAIAGLPAGRTCLTVAHDAALVRCAGRVLRLEDGRLQVEEPPLAAAAGGVAAGV